MTLPLINRARSIIATNLALQPGETLLIVTDDPTREVGELFYEAAQAPFTAPSRAHPHWNSSSSRT